MKRLMALSLGTERPQLLHRSIACAMPDAPHTPLHFHAPERGPGEASPSVGKDSFDKAHAASKMQIEQYRKPTSANYVATIREAAVSHKARSRLHSNAQYMLRKLIWSVALALLGPCARGRAWSGRCCDASTAWCVAGPPSRSNHAALARHDAHQVTTPGP